MFDKKAGWSHQFTNVKKHPFMWWPWSSGSEPRGGCVRRVLETRHTVNGIRRRMICLTHKVRFTELGREKSWKGRKHGIGV